MGLGLPALAWGALLVTCVGCGASLCAALVVPGRVIWVPLLAAVGSAVAAIAAIALIGAVAARSDSAVAATGIGIAAVFGGYALGASLLPSALKGRTRPLRVVAPSDGDRVHVILLADAEPERYTPVMVATALADLESMDVPVPPDAARPLVYAAERSRYRQAGGSPARASVRAVADAVSDSLDAEAFDLPVATAYCDGAPTLAEAVADAAARGGSRVVVAIHGVAESRAFDLAEREAALAGAEGGAVRLSYTAPLWSSAEIAESVARRILEAVAGDGEVQTGVVLASAGQPAEWDEAFPETAEHSTYFCQRVRAELVTAGLREDLVRLAWLDWTEPGVTEVVRHLAALDCQRICVAPATMPFDTVSTLLDLRAAAVQAAADTDATITVLAAWDGDPAVARALHDRVVEAARESDAG